MSLKTILLRLLTQQQAIMYRPKKHVRLTALPAAPDLTNVRKVFDEARKARGCTVELPWKNKRTKVPYSLTVRVELAGGDPVWTLYEGDGDQSRVVWSSSFEDVELLYDVLLLSIPDEFNSGIGVEKPTSTAEFESLKSGNYPSVPSSSTPEPSPAPSSQPQFSDKPPGYYDSGLLKEEDLEIYKQKESSKQSQDVEKRKEKSSSKSKKKSKKDKSKTAKVDKEQSPHAQSGLEQEAPVPSPPAEPSHQSGAYPQPYPPQDPSRQSGAYPQYPPPGYQYPPPGYHYPPPGYPYPPQQYPPPGYPAPPQHPQHQAEASVPTEAPQKEVPKKDRPNVRLGKFLVEAGIVPQATVDAALQLQDLVRSGSLPTIKAAEAVRRAHVRGGQVDPALTAIRPSEDTKSIAAPPLGQILVEAAILRGPILKTALALQNKVRDSEINKEEAIDQLCVEVFGVGAKRSSKLSESEDSTKAVELLKSSGLISEFDLETASKVKDKHGGRLINILESAGKIDSLTVEASLKCVELMKQEKINLDKAAIALHFCQRSRVGLEDALGELGWKKSVLGIEDEVVEVIEIIEYVDEDDEDS